MSQLDGWLKYVDGDNDEIDDEVILPSPVVTVDEVNKIKKTVHYKKVEEKPGVFVYKRAVTHSRILVVPTKISKRAIERKTLGKFGECDGQTNGECERGITSVCPDPVQFEWEHERPDEEDDELLVMKQVFKKTEQETILEEIIPEHILRQQTEEKRQKKARYGPAGRTPLDKRHNDIENTPTIRINSIPTNATFDDIKVLVRRFGSKRIKLPRNKDNENENRGFAFVTFDSRPDAERAKEALHGHPYGTNILHAEWSRNYLNYLNANPQEKALIDNRDRIGPPMRRAGGGRLKFINSKTQAGRK